MRTQPVTRFWLALGMTLAMVGLFGVSVTPTAHAASAADPIKKKLYKWTTPDGHVYYSDEIPPDQIGQAHDEKSVKSGLTTQHLDRFVSPEERAAQAALLEKQAALDQVKNAENLRVQAMVASYANEQVLIAAFAEHQRELIAARNATALSLSALRKSQADQLSLLSGLELANKPIPPDRRTALISIHAQVVQQTQQFAVQSAALLALKLEQQQSLAAYRALKSGSPIAPPPVQEISPAGTR